VLEWANAIGRGKSYTGMMTMTEKGMKEIPVKLREVGILIIGHDGDGMIHAVAGMGGQ
jgi:hypothetical protein